MKEGTSTLDSSVELAPSEDAVMVVKLTFRPNLGLPNGLGPALEDAELKLPVAVVVAEFTAVDWAEGPAVPEMGTGATGGLLLGLDVGLCKGVDWALVVALPLCILVHADPPKW